MSKDLDKANKKTVYRSLIVAVVMFGFGFFALVPLYNLVCEKFGFNGTTQKVSAKTARLYKVDKTRTITVVFDSNVNSALPWKFYPKTPKVDIHPGETKKIFYVAHNNSGRAITGQAIFNVSPPEAARFFKKTECFCFTKQKLEHGETKEMPVVFAIDPRISSTIKIVYLSYTFFNIDKYLKK